MPVNSIPQVQTDDRVLGQIQSNITNIVNSVFKNSPIIAGNYLKSIALAIGNTTINHGLNGSLQGWVVIRKRGPANIYDVQDANPNPGKTLVLVSDAVVTIDILVF